MGTGIVFVYLVIAAMVAPFVWVSWWAVASIGRESAQKAPAPARAPVARPQRNPFPLDLRLVSRPRAVTVYSAAGQEISTCPGPNADGRCSRPLGDGTVPCAGCLLALPQPIRGSFEWHIPSGYQSCLLGSYDVFRARRPAPAQPI